MAWEHRDASNASVRGSSTAAELEPMGSNAGAFKPLVYIPRTQQTLEAERTYPFYSATTLGQCTLDGIESNCEFGGSEGSVQCPPSGCRSTNLRTNRVEYFRAYADRRSGYLPPDASYVGGGTAYSFSRASAMSVPGAPVDELAGFIELDKSQETFLNHSSILQKTNDCDKILSAAQLPGAVGPGWYRYSPRTGANLSGDPGLMSYAQPNAIATIMDFAAKWNQVHPNHPIGIGEMGALGGKGDFSRHPGSGHAGGNIIDIRPMTINGNAVRLLGSLQSIDVAGGKVNYRQTPAYKQKSFYSQSLTQELVDGLLGTGGVESIRFNDPGIKGVRPSDSSHDNHLHVVFKSICH